MSPPWMADHEADMDYFQMTHGKPYPPGYEKSLHEHPEWHLGAILLAFLVVICHFCHARKHQRHEDVFARDH